MHFYGVWNTILSFIALIPARANNSVVDAVFEEEMKKLFTSPMKTRWEAFVMFLKTHRANPGQERLSVDNISWISMIRLMRNIFSHEYSFSWYSLRNFCSEVHWFFGDNGEGFCKMMKVYARCCRTIQPTEPLFPLSTVAHIQLKNSGNCCLVPCNSHKSSHPHTNHTTHKTRGDSPSKSNYLPAAAPFVGLDSIAKVTNYWRHPPTRSCGTAHSTDLEGIVAVIGPPMSGRTTLAKCVLPHILTPLKGKEEFSDVLHLDFSQRGVASFDEFMSFLDDSINLWIHPHKRYKYTPDSESSNQLEVRSEMCLNLLGSGKFLLLDNIESALFSFEQPDRVQLVKFLHFIDTEPPGTEVVLITGGQLLPLILYLVAKDAGIPNWIPFKIIETGMQLGNTELSHDFQRLLRHYYGTPKLLLSLCLETLGENHASAALLACTAAACCNALGAGARSSRTTEPEPPGSTGSRSSNHREPAGEAADPPQLPVSMLSDENSQCVTRVCNYMLSQVKQRLSQYLMNFASMYPQYWASLIAHTTSRCDCHTTATTTPSTSPSTVHSTGNGSSSCGGIPWRALKYMTISSTRRPPQPQQQGGGSGGGPRRTEFLYDLIMSLGQDSQP
ncbi:hypothetical protein Pelo_6023 [Pelomyxa schiedti]|nr:hypothetical protein Pelo_6023 [Pelomyxa schiedti]